MVLLELDEKRRWLTETNCEEESKRPTSNYFFAFG
jgi:hypothetical protein